MKLKHLILLAIPLIICSIRGFTVTFPVPFIEIIYGSIIAYQLYQINHKLDYLKDKDDLKDHQQ